jgi:uncharacterized protein
MVVQAGDPRCSFLGGIMSLRFIAPRLLLGALLPATLLFDTPAAMAQRTEPATSVAPARDPEKLKAIRTLLDITGSVKTMQRIVNTMLDEQAAQHPEIPAEYWKRFKTKFKPEELAERILPVYDKHFTREEINQMIVFYQSPVGKKMAELEAPIQQQCMAIGQQYGQELGMQIAQEMQREAQDGKSGKSGNPAKPAKPNQTKQ